MAATIVSIFVIMITMITVTMIIAMVITIFITVVVVQKMARVMIIMIQMALVLMRWPLMMMMWLVLMVHHDGMIDGRYIKPSPLLGIILRSPLNGTRRSKHPRQVDNCCFKPRTEGG